MKKTNVKFIFQLTIGFVLGITLCIFSQRIVINASTVSGSASSVQNAGNTPEGTDEITDSGTITVNVDQHYDDGEQAGKNIVMEVPISEIGTEDFTNRIKEAGISSTKLLKGFPGLLAYPSTTEPNVTSIINYNGTVSYLPLRNEFGNTGASAVENGLIYNKKQGNLKFVRGFSLVYFKPIKISINQMDSNGKSLGKDVNFSLDIGESLDNVNADIDGKIQDVSDQLISEGEISNKSDFKGSYYIETDQDGNENKLPITKDSLDKDITTLQNDYSYKNLSPIASESGKSVTKVLLQSFALIGEENDSKSYISGAESHEDKNIEIHLVYQPKKDTNPNKGTESSGSTGSSTSSSVSQI